MTRLLHFLVRNWPLKLGALAMAILLYGGLVLSENAQEFQGRIPIEDVNQPKSVIVLSNLGDVRLVRYFASDPSIRPDSSSFKATVDLAGVDPVAGTVSLAVNIIAIDPRIQILDWEPSRINVQVDERSSRLVPVKVDWGVAPPGLDVQTPAVSVDTVSVAGPASVISRVAAAEAHVRIDPSGIDIDQDVELVPVDDLGEAVTPANVTPPTVRVKIAVFTNGQTKSVPVTPVVNGVPAAGYEIAAITVDPPIISVEGDADQLASLTRIDTVPVSIAGASSSLSAVTGLSLPTGVLTLTQPTVNVRVTLRQVAATRTLSAGLVLVGTKPDIVYSLGVDHVLVTLGGPAAELDKLAGTAFTVSLDVSALTVGSKSVNVSVTLPTGVTLIALSPQAVTVTAAQPSPSPTPAATPTPSPSPPPPSPTPTP